MNPTSTARRSRPNATSCCARSPTSTPSRPRATSTATITTPCATTTSRARPPSSARSTTRPRRRPRAPPSRASKPNALVEASWRSQRVSWSPPELACSWPTRSGRVRLGAPYGLAPDSTGDRLAAGWQLVRRARRSRRCRLYDRVLKDDPNQPVALAYRGWLVRLAGLKDEGLAYVDRAVAADPSYPDAHFFRGMMLWEDRSDPAAAVAEFRLFLANNPPQAMVALVEDALARAARGRDSRIVPISGESFSLPGRNRPVLFPSRRCAWLGRRAAEVPGICRSGCGGGGPAGGSRSLRVTGRRARAASRPPTETPWRTRSTSSAVVDQPTETRRLLRASTPIASSTGDGSSASDEHALPECAATPAWSRPSNTASASTPLTPTHTMCGTRLSGSPYGARRSTASAAWTSASVLTRAAVASSLNVFVSSAAPHRTMPRRQGSRGRRAAPAPGRRRAQVDRGEGRDAPTARRCRRAAELGRAHRHEVDADSSKAIGSCPAAAAASTWSSTPRSAHSDCDLRDGL